MSVALGNREDSATATWEMSEDLYCKKNRVEAATLASTRETITLVSERVGTKLELHEFARSVPALYECSTSKIKSYSERYNRKESIGVNIMRDFLLLRLNIGLHCRIADGGAD